MGERGRSLLRASSNSGSWLYERLLPNDAKRVEPLGAAPATGDAERGASFRSATVPPGCGEQPCRRQRSESPSEENPLVRRNGRQNRQVYTALAGGSAISEALTFPSVPDCAHCHRQLGAEEMRWGTGLCDACYTVCKKDCSICNRRLPKMQLQFGTGLCNECYDSSDKNCKLCTKSLALHQLHWNTGLCDDCYNSCGKNCRTCSKRLEFSQLHWGTGLCDECYSSVDKVCRICHHRIEQRQLRWNSGLCNSCYDGSEKVCSMCQCHIALGSLHWRTRMCDPCYDKCVKVCKVCLKGIEKQELHWATGLCDICYSKCEKTCAMCTERINSKQLHWGSGLCDVCYNDCDKQCKICKVGIPFGQRRWGSGLCDTCYDNCERTCRICSTTLPLGQLHWGTRVCDTCFDACGKQCRECRTALQLGQLHWGTGLCDVCYDTAHARKGLTRGVQAIIAAQFVFYSAPTSLQPSLFLQIKEVGYSPSPAAVFAAVLTTASFSAMVAPVLLGLWAEYRGAREVYYGVTLVAAFGAAVLMLDVSAPIFAFSWACLNLPPAIRGVRATYFAKHVAPEELSRAGQLASSAGLMGGFVGPFISVWANGVFGPGSPTRLWNGFRTCSAVSVALLCACASGLAWAIKAAKTSRSRNGSSSGHREHDREDCPSCELCCVQLSSAEQKFTMALCNNCYDRFGGENCNFKRYSRRVLVSFCLISMLLEISMNAGVIATFQPLAVSWFGWGSDAIAAVNFVGAGLSVAISLTMAHLRLPEKLQMVAAAGFYLFGVLVYAVPPLTEWRLVVGLMLGIKAQILFMAPFTAIFSRLIGGARVTNRLTTALCLAPAIGAALGTVIAPAFVDVASTWLFAAVALPAMLACVLIAAAWPMMDRVPKPGSRRPLADGSKSDAA